MKSEKAALAGFAEVSAMALKIFGNEDAAKVWLNSPNYAFLGVAPIEYLQTTNGLTQVRQVLNTIATGGLA
ncbi:DUF2384 domain-containing protein [Pseudoduganella sp. FT26W]|uniref:DUF2384 domain-containing protein n=1 Tax=Duganella aquatilis TaxID=2666082 RepID=A0A844D1N2_9BURK|nr:MbcA/ParS/Xre antitoxin family protein [Duganella aquatilis]MRW84871.1 DUF2384 domain-containing protein [Duganella aquatilis]